jgi:predicted transcriptional regulator
LGQSAPYWGVTLVYDEILDAKVKLEKGKLNRFNNPKDGLLNILWRKRERQILDVVLKHDDGIAHGELSQEVGLDRKNLRHYMSRLIGKGLITRGEGLHGKYYPTTKARRGISLTADILANSFVSNILDNDNFLIDIPSLNTNPTKFSELEHEVLKLSNMFGGFITYILIQSMNPENKITEGSKNPIEKDIAVQAWLENIISIFMQNIVSRFEDRVFYHLESIGCNIPPNPSDEFFDKAVKLSDWQIVSELINCFSNLYPNLSRVLEKTRSELPKLVAREKKHIRFVAKKAKLQMTCTHEYKTIRKYSYDNHRFERCRKCHKTRIKTE